MIDSDRFIRDVCDVLGQKISSNQQQTEIVRSDFSRCLKVVAGPGSGKTTVLVLRLLMMIFVDDVKTSEIIATTFTRKAASELKSRILRWGQLLQSHYRNDPALDQDIRNKIGRLNFDLIVTGTLDSIAEDTLTVYRLPDENPPVLIDDFVSSQIMFSLFPFDKREEMKEELKNNGLLGYKTGIGDMVDSVSNVYYRCLENEIDVTSLADEVPLTSGMMKRYVDTLEERQFKDFPTLEGSFLDFLSKDRSEDFINGVRVLMVDEYQDTNILQEHIYKVLTDRIVKAGGSVIFVGDDDQSIYRFRGSRVHLFANLEERFSDTSAHFDTIFLTTNYRSTPTIVDFCNRFIAFDEGFQEVRVKEKPPIIPGRECEDDPPIFAIFRDTPGELARDIAILVEGFSEGGSYTFHADDGTDYYFERDLQGSAADVVMLMGSTSNYTDNGEKKLPRLVDSYFEEHDSKLRVFNPRGDKTYQHKGVSVLCGSILMCLDPDGSIQNNLRFKTDEEKILNTWRLEAKEYIDNAEEFNGCKMSDLISSWQEGKPYPKNNKWSKKEVSLLDMIFNLLTWMPEMRNDAESLTYLQSVCNAIKNSVLIKNREINVIFENGSSKPKESAVKEIYNKIFRPIVTDTLDIDEDLMFSVNLKDRFSIMTIHQSKGLEFPITIVDVSSEFQKDTSKFKRFPDKPDNTSNIEGLMRRHSPDIQDDRDLLDTQFDDLIRKFFVAYSRAQDVLILVGLNRTLKKDKPLKHVALGWDRTGEWKWKDLPGIKFMR